jgi:pyruvate dehydrogenase E2 component (dihydrolipoamide acetyltransferase)
MTIEFKLPEIAEGVESADVADIFVSVGDVIEAEQVVMELETEKAVAGLPCPQAGRVAKVHVSRGDTVKIGQTLLTLEEAESETAGAGEEAKPKVLEERESSESPTRERGKADERTSPVEEERRREESPAAKAAPPKPKDEDPEEEEHPQKRGGGGDGRKASEPKPAAAGERARPEAPAATQKAPRYVPAPEREREAPAPAGPATRRLARELGVDLYQVTGTGPGGRITPEDVRAYVRGLTAGSAFVAENAIAAARLPDFSRFGPIAEQPLNKIAKTSAANLTISWHAIPHVTQHDLADITELEAARKQYLKAVGDAGPKITMTAILIKASVAALKAFPHFNSSLDAASGSLIVKSYYNIGVAVDTEYGLLVPVIREADKKNIRQLATELADMAERARNRRLDINEMQGGTFTITNLGGIGGTAFTPIVNYPEVAILGVSRSQKQLQMANGAPQERLMLPLSLSYDHRVINGADAARFVVKFTNMLAGSFQLLLEC